MDEPGARLIGEQLARLRDQLEARLDRLEAAQAHQRALDDERWSALRRELDRLHAEDADHEGRLRDAAQGVTSFRTWIALTSGGSVLAAAAALLKAFLGR